jgi:YesN/AraC family two-component response regulator
MSYKILVIDDEYLIRSRIKNVIVNSGLPCEIVGEADDGVKGLEELKHCMPHIAIIDINMPNMDGLAFALQARKLLPEIVMMILTGYRLFDYAAEAINLGIFKYILKPIDRDELLENLVQAVAKLEKTDTPLRCKPDLAAISLMRSRCPINISATSAERLIAQQVRSFLESEFRNDTIGLDIIADSVAKSPNHISETFSRVMGKSVMEYLTELRLNYARNFILENPDSTLEVIAAEAGYSDQYYFSRKFKRLFGQSPIKFRVL